MLGLPREVKKSCAFSGSFETCLEPTAVPPGSAAGRARGVLLALRAAGAHLVAALFVAGSIVAILDTTIPVFIGRVVTLVSAARPGSLLHDNWPQLVGMALVLLVARPVALLLQNLITNQAIIPGFSNLIRWQSHWHVVRQSWAFFQNDFAGRIAQRVMQTGPSLRESVVSATNAVWYILVYGGGAIVLLASSDARLAIPVLLWFAGYAALLRYFVPRLRIRSRRMSETRSALSGRVVDSYTNIQTVKLFARPRDEDEFVRAAMDDLTDALPRPAAADDDARADPRHAQCGAGRRHRRSSRSGCGTSAGSRSAPSRWRCR